MDNGAAEDLAGRLRGSVRRGELVLFTGAGFTAGARNISGTGVPSSEELRQLIWGIAFGGPVDNDSTLQEVFEVAQREAPSHLSKLLRGQLSIDSTTITRQQLAWLTFPWRRAYTVNVDDLEQAAMAREGVSRTIVSVSALRRETLPDAQRDLTWIHLNGDLADVPDVTFTEQQYGARTTREDALFSRLVSDLNVSPVVFVGSSLREAQLWRYLELRRLDNPEQASLQPTSFLVTPTLAKARASMLSAMNIEWIATDAADFADSVFARLHDDVAAGHRSLALAGGADDPTPLQRVSDLLSNAPAISHSLYLTGAQPTWSDVAAGRTASRRFEADLPVETSSGTVLVTSTAGEGTSTTLMRLAARLQVAGRETLWHSAREHASGQRLRQQVRGKTGDFVLVVDDADMLGLQLEHLQRDLRSEPQALLVLGMRSSRIDAALPTWVPDGNRNVEVNVPRLEDHDIQELLELLERQGALGLLTPKAPEARFHALQQQAGRLLVVAMLLVTEGYDLRVKVEDEFSQLAQPQRSIYGAVALASQFRYKLAQDEVLQAAGAMTAVGATAVERLVARNLIVAAGGGYESRHRMVAELVVRKMTTDGTLPQAHSRLLAAVAVRLTGEQLRDPKRRQRSARYRLARALMNHRSMDHYRLEEARKIYRDAEPFLSPDYHFWLQRGSLEVRREQFEYAERYLKRAQAECPIDDFRVEVEWCNMLLHRAGRQPRAPSAAVDADEGYTALRRLIDDRGTSSAYPFHVLLSQYPRWLEKSALAFDEKRRRFEELRTLGERAVALHGNDAGMRDLQRGVEAGYLRLSVQPPGRDRKP
jgi:tetratricopeptide (TPR) repeat protein